MFRRTYYQYYTNVNYLACPDCLARHGEIRTDPGRFPEARDGCARRILEFPRDELSFFREQQRVMRRTAKDEIIRRDLFAEATARLPDDPVAALERFRRAAGIDVYIPDLERLAARRAEFLASHPEVREQLRTLFSRAFSDKFGRRRYERLPERMRLQREKWGMERIRALFS